MAKKKITATPEELRESFGLTMNYISATAMEAKERTERAYCEVADPNFYLAPVDKLEEEFLDQYKDDLLVEFYGAIFSTAIRRQYDLQKEEGKNPSARTIAEDLLNGSLFGQLLPLAQEDIDKNISRDFVHAAMEQTKEKVFKEETRQTRRRKILFEQKHFGYVDAGLWDDMLPYLKQASFLTIDNLIRLVIYRETGFILKDYNHIPELNEYLKKKYLPSKQTIFETGLQKLLADMDAKLATIETDVSNDLYWGADFLWGEVVKANHKARKEFLKISDTRREKYQHDRNQ